MRKKLRKRQKLLRNSIKRKGAAMKPFIILLLLGALSACSGLETNSAQVEVGTSKADVLSSMGSAPYPDSKDDVLAWRYASRVSFGYCDYREIFLYNDVVIHINQYYRASRAGCLTGLQEIDWGPALAKKR